MKLLICNDALMNVSTLPLANVLFTAVAELSVRWTLDGYQATEPREQDSALDKFIARDTSTEFQVFNHISTKHGPLYLTKYRNFFL
jgi:hypothetical protein